MTYTIENGWHVATCVCGWLRAEPNRAACEREAGVHEKKCKEET